MADLSTHYLGLALRNPLIVGSSGWTQTVEGIRRCEDAGAGAVVLKSVFEEQIQSQVTDLLASAADVPWRVEAEEYLERYGREGALEEYLQLIREAKKAVSIPVIASINCVSEGAWMDFASRIEAAGADAAIVSAYTPAYRRWRDSLPAGPVTLHDLATLDALPEYIMVGEVRGSTLASLARNAAASTILPDKRHPAYEPARFLLASEIDPDRTYRVAFSGGAPAYAAEYRKMPKLLFFKSPEEFLAGKHASLPVRKLRQIPVTVTEAVAEYIRERKRVSPRPACFDLAGYFADPRHNEFGAYDWLNVGVDAPVRASGGGATERYVLSIALQPAGEPSSAPPRENSKAFLEPAATGRPATFDFARLGRHLNVSAEVALRPVAVAVGDDGFRLVGPDAQAALIGRGLVVTVRLRSRSEKDLVGLAGLRPGVLRRIHGSIWPDDRQGGKRTWYTGLYRSAGPYRKPPVRQDAALFLWPEGQARRLTRLSLKGAGYNFGLVAAYRPIRLPAGKTLTLPLLFLAVEKPAKVEKLDLAEMLEKIKPDLLASGG